MENCLLRECPKCGHKTIHYTGDKLNGSLSWHQVLRGDYPEGEVGDGDYEKAYKTMDEVKEKWKAEHLVETFTCTVCGTRWVVGQ